MSISTRDRGVNVLRGAVRATVFLVAGGVVVATLAALLLDCRLLVVRSGSMAPSFDTGSLAFARPVGAREVEVGDVVTVTADAGTLITHRVVSARRFGEQATLTLQGDANAAPDQERYVVSRVHRVAWSVPRLGYVVDELKGPRGLAGLLATVLLVLVLVPGRLRSSRVPMLVATTVLLGGALHAVQGVVGTWAAFNDSAVLASGGFMAATVVPPTDVVCVNNGAQDYIRWTAPPGFVPTAYRVHVDGSATPTAEVGPATLQWRPPVTLFPRTYAQVQIVAVRGTWSSAPSATSDSISTLFLFQGTAC